MWSPWLKKDLIAIEQVQRRATRIVRDIAHLSYEDRLRELGLPTLIYRRDRADVVQLFKVMNKFDEVSLPSIRLSNTTTTRGHTLKLQKSHNRLKMCMNSYVPRSINNWNNLTEECVHSKTVNSFKDNLNVAWKHLANKFYYNF